MVGPESQHQHQKQQVSGAMILKSSARTALFLWRGLLEYVQHDGGIRQKTVEDTISDGSRKEVLNLEVSWVVDEY